MNKVPLRLGLTMWSHAPWQASIFGSGTKSAQRLEKYSHFFNTVEGNTTFYATPSPTTVRNWATATPDDFRFTFKLPKQVTHNGNLRSKQSELFTFLNVMEPIMEKIGLWTIQLPATFTPAHLSELKDFVKYFPKDAPLAIEVRDLQFFNKGHEEQQFNRWLVEASFDRIIMDSRPIFSVPATTEMMIDAQQKKPKVPVHAIATANHPMVRFIGLPTPADNNTFVTPWINKLSEWIKSGKTPYLMVHTANNDFAPELAAQCYDQLSTQLNLPVRPKLLNGEQAPQITLF